VISPVGYGFLAVCSVSDLPFQFMITVRVEVELP